MSGPQAISRRLWLSAILVGVVYWIGALARSGVAFEDLASIPKPLVVATKGLFSALLAMSVFASQRGAASFLVAAALAVSAIGDMLLVTIGSAARGLVFALAQVLAGYAYATIQR